MSERVCNVSKQASGAIERASERTSLHMDSWFFWTVVHLMPNHMTHQMTHLLLSLILDMDRLVCWAPPLLWLFSLFLFIILSSIFFLLPFFASVEQVGLG